MGGWGLRLRSGWDRGQEAPWGGAGLALRPPVRRMPSSPAPSSLLVPRPPPDRGVPDPGGRCGGYPPLCHPGQARMEPHSRLTTRRQELITPVHGEGLRPDHTGVRGVGGMRLGKLKSRAREPSELVCLSLPGHRAQRGQGLTQGYTVRRARLWTPRPPTFCSDYASQPP